MADNLNEWLSSLAARTLLPVQRCDENVAASEKGSLEADFHHWKGRFWSEITDTGEAATLIRSKEKRKVPCSSKTKCAKCAKKEADEKVRSL